jgi:hypothetical protein
MLYQEKYGNHGCQTPEDQNLCFGIKIYPKWYFWYENIIFGMKILFLVWKYYFWYENIIFGMKIPIIFNMNVLFLV